MFMLYYFSKEGSQIRLSKQKYDVSHRLIVVVRAEFLSRSDLRLQPWAYEHSTERELLDMPYQRCQHDYRAVQTHVPL